MTRVLIVDDERMVRELFGMYIAAAADRYTLAEAVDDARNAQIVCMGQKIDLILMDVCTANNASGLDAAKSIKERFPNIKIIIVTSAPEYRFIEKAKAVGADSFWYKDTSEVTLLDIMDRTMQGESVYPEHTPMVSIGLATSTDFTPKELEVLLHLSSGEATWKIAEEMNISLDTVNTHIKHLKSKTGCATKTQLAIYATRARLVLPEY